MRLQRNPVNKSTDSVNFVYLRDGEILTNDTTDNESNHLEELGIRQEHDYVFNNLAKDLNEQYSR